MYEAHNIVLQTLADTGLIGFAGLLALFSGLVLAARRLSRATAGAQGISYLTAATLLTGLMQNDLRDSEYLYAFWFFLSLLLVQSAALGAGRQEADGDERKPAENLQSPAGRPDPA
jgi:O-antigen ligase